MKSMYPKLVIVAMLAIITLTINFRYTSEPIQITQPQAVKKVIVVKKIYIRVPLTKDSTSGPDSVILTLPKEPAPFNYKKYYRSRNLHKNVFIS